MILKHNLMHLTKDSNSSALKNYKLKKPKPTTNVQKKLDLPRLIATLVNHYLVYQKTMSLHKTVFMKKKLMTSMKHFVKQRKKKISLLPLQVKNLLQWKKKLLLLKNQ